MTRTREGRGPRGAPATWAWTSEAGPVWTLEVAPPPSDRRPTLHRALHAIRHPEHLDRSGTHTGQQSPARVSAPGRLLQLLDRSAVPARRAPNLLQTGPLAYNGVLAFWIPVIIFCIWMLVMPWATHQAVRSEPQVHSQDASPSSKPALVRRGRNPRTRQRAQRHKDTPSDHHATATGTSGLVPIVGGALGGASTPGPKGTVPKAAALPDARTPASPRTGAPAVASRARAPA